MKKCISLAWHCTLTSFSIAFVLYFTIIWNYKNAITIVLHFYTDSFFVDMRNYDLFQIDVLFILFILFQWFRTFSMWITGIHSKRKYKWCLISRKKGWKNRATDKLQRPSEYWVQREVWFYIRPFDKKYYDCPYFNRISKYSVFSFDFVVSLHKIFYFRCSVWSKFNVTKIKC